MKGTEIRSAERGGIVVNDPTIGMLRADKWENTRVAAESLRRHQDMLDRIEAGGITRENLESLLRIRYRINWEIGSITEVGIENAHNGKSVEESQMLDKLLRIGVALSERASELIRKHMTAAQLQARWGNSQLMREVGTALLNYVDQRDQDPY